MVDESRIKYVIQVQVSWGWVEEQGFMYDTIDEAQSIFNQIRQTRSAGTFSSGANAVRLIARAETVLEVFTDD